MKKFLSLAMLVCLLIASLSTSNVTIYAAEKVNSGEENQFAHKVLSATSPSRAEYQLSESQRKVPTAELIDTILCYPFLVDLFCSSTSTENAYESLRNSFNGFVELESRNDAASVMLKKLVAGMKSSQYDLTVATCLYTLISLPTYEKCLTNEEKAEFRNISPEHLTQSNK